MSTFLALSGISGFGYANEMISTIAAKETTPIKGFFSSIAFIRHDASFLYTFFRYLNVKRLVRTFFSTKNELVRIFGSENGFGLVFTAD